jgi:Homeodomain-like domain-containing protein
MPGGDRCASHLGRAGAKPKLTPELADRIVALISRGVPLAVTAAACGVSRASVYRWIARPEPEFRSFAERVRQARVNRELAFVAAVLRQGGWRGAACLLERIAPGTYGRPSDRPATSDAPPDPFAEFAAVSYDDAARIAARGGRRFLRSEILRGSADRRGE